MDSTPAGVAAFSQDLCVPFYEKSQLGKGRFPLFFPSKKFFCFSNFVEGANNSGASDSKSLAWCLLLVPRRGGSSFYSGSRTLPRCGPMMVGERAGLFSGSRVQARMDCTKLGTRIHLTLRNRSSLDRTASGRRSRDSRRKRHAVLQYFIDASHQQARHHNPRDLHAAAFFAALIGRLVTRDLARPERGFDQIVPQMHVGAAAADPAARAARAVARGATRPVASVATRPVARVATRPVARVATRPVARVATR